MSLHARIGRLEACIRPRRSRCIWVGHGLRDPHSETELHPDAGESPAAFRARAQAAGWDLASADSAHAVLLDCLAAFDAATVIPPPSDHFPTHMPEEGEPITVAH